MRRKILTLGILRILSFPLSFPFARGLAIVFEKVLGLLLVLFLELATNLEEVLMLLPQRPLEDLYR